MTRRKSRYETKVTLRTTPLATLVPLGHSLGRCPRHPRRVVFRRGYLSWILLERCWEKGEASSLSPVRECPLLGKSWVDIPGIGPTASVRGPMR